MVTASGRTSVNGLLATSAVLDDCLAAELLQVLIADALGLLGHELALDIGTGDRITVDAPCRADRDQRHALVDLRRRGRLAYGRVADFLAVVAGELVRGPSADV